MPYASKFARNEWFKRKRKLFRLKNPDVRKVKYIKTGRSSGHRPKLNLDYLGVCSKCGGECCNCKICLAQKNKSDICLECQLKELSTE